MSERIVLDSAKEILSDYANVKNRLYIRLQNRSMVSDLCEEIPPWDFLDLAITCRILIGENATASASTTVKPQLLETAGISREQLLRDAFISSQKLRPAKTGSMSSIMSMLGCVYESVPDECELTVVTTENYDGGAVAILYPNILDSLATGHNLFLIPSSVHEFLCLPDNGKMEVEGIEELIRDVNREIVAPKEVLSNRLYYYDRERKEIRFAREDSSDIKNYSRTWRVAYEEN